MTITTTTNRQSFAGDGTTNPWVFNFPIVVSSDLLVIRRNADTTETALVLNTDYTVSAGPYTTGGSVTPLAVTVVGATYFVIGNVPGTQVLALQDGGPLPAASLNGALDRLTMIYRRLLDLVSRGPKLRDTDTPGSGKIDAGGNEMTNLHDGTVGSSAATVNQLAAVGGVVPASSVTKRQVILALTDITNPAGANVFALVNNAIDPVAADAGSAQWLGGARMVVSDSLYALIQTATGWSGAQMTSFFTLAQNKAV